MVFNLLVLLLRRTLVSTHLTLLDLVTQLPTLLQLTLLMLVSQDQVEVEEEVSQKQRQQLHLQVQLVLEVLLSVVVQENDPHQYSHRLHKDQIIKWVDT